MGYKNATGGLNFQYPEEGDQNWYSAFEAMLLLISSHSHSSAPNGAQIGNAGLQADAVDDTKLRLRNAQYLRARNAAGSADINICRLDSSDRFELNPTIVDPITFSPDVVPGGLMTGTETINYARYAKFGPFVKIWINFTVTLGGTANQAIAINNLPITSRAGVVQVLSGQVLKSGFYYRHLDFNIGGSSTSGTLSLWDYSSFEVGTSLQFYVTGEYLGA